VAKATPVITWATPAPISYGTPLSSLQLNATANVPGTFSYTPPAGTILSGGTQTLSVIFTPTDSVDYAPATASVTLTVTQAQIKLSQTSINFGTVVLGKILTQTEVVTNVGTAPLKISKIAVITGPTSDWDDFTYITLCGPTLAPGASCNTFIFFLADDLGTRAATLAISDNVPGLTLPSLMAQAS
jgi:hypothetical protein